MNRRFRRYLGGLILACCGAFLIWLAAAFTVDPPSIILPRKPIPSFRSRQEEQLWDRNHAGERQPEREPKLSGLGWYHYLADTSAAVRDFHGVGILLGLGTLALMIGYILMMHGVLTRSVPSPSLPGPLARVSDTVESRPNPAPAEPDAIRPPPSTDIK
jgi:hypothetical protein